MSLEARVQELEQANDRLRHERIAFLERQNQRLTIQARIRKLEKQNAKLRAPARVIPLRPTLTQSGPRTLKELYEQIEKGELPDFTVENIMNTIGNLAGRVNTLLNESIKEVFDWLRPQNQWGTGALKTNHKFYVGEKAIVGWAVERNYGGGFRINYHREANFRALGNVFSLLDGKGVMKYPDDFYTRFNEYFKTRQAGDKFDDDYFECKCYGNGNMHIRFKRKDLLAKLNQIGGDGSLPGEEAAA